MKPHNKIALAGDWHGNWMTAISLLDQLADRNVDLVLHLGDFGIWPGDSGRRYLENLESVCAQHDIDIWVTPGNHEDWAALDAMWDEQPQDDEGRPTPLELTEHISVLPRGYRFSLQASAGKHVSFVSLGGAPSIDFTMRREGRDWWPSEMITDEHVDAVIADGYADVMLTHDSPGLGYCTDAVAEILSNDDAGWPAAGLAYAHLGTERLTRAFLGVKPRLLAHGHMHVVDATTVQLPDTDHATQVWALSADGEPGNVRLIDLNQI